ELETLACPRLQDLREHRVDRHGTRALRLEWATAVLVPHHEARQRLRVLEVAPPSAARLALAETSEQAERVQHPDRPRDLVVPDQHHHLGRRVRLAFIDGRTLD